jgi:hypothetical protein
MIKTIKFDAEGRPMSTEVKIGSERINHRAHSQLAKGFLVCENHGTVPTCYVKTPRGLALCCRACIIEHCKITEAVVRMNFEDYCGSDMDHPGWD